MDHQIITYFDVKIAACQTAVTALNADHRADEAIFEKIRMNVYGIFRSIYKTGIEVCGADESKLREFLLPRFENITATWKASYDSAAQHRDSAKMHIEQLKLDTVEEIRQMVLKGGREA